MRSLFVIGDSISIQYGPHLKWMVEGAYRYDRKRGEQEALADLDRPAGANGGDSSLVLEYLQKEDEKGTRYDLLLLNCGLHDIKTDMSTRSIQITAEQYRTNLEEILALSIRMAKETVWVRTTDVVDRIHNERSQLFFRYHRDVVAYNEIADQVFGQRDVPILDLYRFSRIFGESAYNDHVHFTEEVRRLQAAYIAGFLDSHLKEGD
ncbi:SGNH/GDSL hydrolase family protein [Paenibacillus agaridevorans]|uniref:SGNH/GDSL hydrolase family protein n=1 Tax=Paenibacillus agaridevorans TaxID=171404 RepID=UPI001BE4B6F2|nr:SGNH/GDSL hydrolase family protein [Paenibacillus agaridevorans]